MRRAVAAAMAGVACLGLAGCEKWRLDQQVKELCAKDGGIRVYETVELPAEQFNQWGDLAFFRASQGEAALGPDFLLKRQLSYLKQGTPQVSRWHAQIVRRTDWKLLGETVIYGRGGGDAPGPWHDSSFHCPSTTEAGESALLRQVFRPQR